MRKIDPELKRQGARARSLRWYHAHKDELPDRSAYMRAYRATHREDGRRNSRKSYAKYRNLMRLYGITPEQYDAMVAAQHGRCAICGRIPTGRPPNGHLLQVDHDHETGLVRGLLCLRCNRAIALLRDDPAVARRAAAYLRRAALRGSLTPPP